MKSMMTPTIELNTGFLLTFIGMIGTTITPYMQFYLQSSIVDKKSVYLSINTKNLMFI